MKFWKFQYDGPSELERCIENRSLPPNKAFPGLSNTYDRTVVSMKLGDGIVIAQLEGDVAKVFALGKVRAIKPVVIDWVRLNLSRMPNSQGLTNWQTKSAFQISPEPAMRYGLPGLIDAHFSAEVKLYDSESDQALEGYLLDRKLLAGARNAALARRRKEVDNNTCQACMLNLKVGNIHVIEVHHLDPLKASGETITTIDRLISLCPTCHRIAHLRSPPYEVREIRAIRNVRTEGNA